MTKLLKGVADKSDVRKALGLLCENKMLRSLLAIKDHPDMVHGTNTNENSHSFLKSHIRKTGGSRSYQVCKIAVKSQQKRFNAAVERNIKAKSLPGGAARDDTESRALASALLEGHSAAGRAARKRALRTPWSELMEETYSANQLMAMGFRPVKAQLSERTLTDEDCARLYAGLQRLLTLDEFIHTQDPYYYVSHHIAERTLTTTECQRLFKYIKRQLTAASASRTTA